MRITKYAVPNFAASQHQGAGASGGNNFIIEKQVQKVRICKKCTKAAGYKVKKIVKKKDTVKQVPNHAQQVSATV